MIPPNQHERLHIRQDLGIAPRSFVSSGLENEANCTEDYIHNLKWAAASMYGGKCDFSSYRKFIDRYGSLQLGLIRPYRLNMVFSLLWSFSQKFRGRRRPKSTQ